MDCPAKYELEVVPAQFPWIHNGKLLIVADVDLAFKSINFPLILKSYSTFEFRMNNHAGHHQIFHSISLSSASYPKMILRSTYFQSSRQETIVVRWSTTGSDNRYLPPSWSLRKLTYSKTPDDKAFTGQVVSSAKEG